MEQQKQNTRPNKPQTNGPKFSMTWIYGLVILGIIAFYFTNGGTDHSSINTETTYSDFKVMVQKGYAKEIVVNKHTNTLLMYVKPEHIYDVFKKHVDQTGNNPAVSVGIGSTDQVEQFVDQMRSEGKFSGKYSYDNSKESGFLDSLVSNLLFFGLTLVVWGKL